MMDFTPEPGEYGGKPVPQEEAFPTRYVLRAMTLEDAHKQGFSTKWFDERAKTRHEVVSLIMDAILSNQKSTYDALADFVSWPTQDGPPR